LRMLCASYPMLFGTCIGLTLFGVHSIRDETKKTSMDATLPSIYDDATDVVKEKWNEISGRVAKVNVKNEMVFHRGFHSFKEVPDLPHRIVSEPWGLSRPLENTVAAFAAVWAMGPNLCECDVTLTADGALVLFHDETIARFREPMAQSDPTLKLLQRQTLEEVQNLTSPLGLESALSGDWSRSGKSGGPLVDYRRLLLPGASEDVLKNWVIIPTLADVLGVAKSMSTKDDVKKLVVEIKANPHTARDTGSAVASWVKANSDLAKHIAVVMSFAEGALEGYHQQGAPHGPNPDDVSLMLLTVKAEDASLPLYQENKVTCDSGGEWTHTDGWNAVPAHVDGYYMEVTFLNQLWWSHFVKANCEIPSASDGKVLALGGWTYPSDPNRVQGLFPSKKWDRDTSKFMTMNAADIEKSIYFLVHTMGFTYVNTDLPAVFDSDGYVTLKRTGSGDMDYRLVELF